jgi:hypothetical protein
LQGAQPADEHPLFCEQFEQLNDLLDTLGASVGP